METGGAPSSEDIETEGSKTGQHSLHDRLTDNGFMVLRNAIFLILQEVG